MPVNNCTELIPGRELCISLSCDTQYTLNDDDTCLSTEWDQPINFGDVRKYNSWINADCTNLQSTRTVYGSVLCLSPQGETHNATGSASIALSISNGCTDVVPYAPEGATVANGITCYCGKWYIVQ